MILDKLERACVCVDKIEGYGKLEFGLRNHVAGLLKETNQKQCFLAIIDLNKGQKFLVLGF